MSIAGPTRRCAHALGLPADPGVAAHYAQVGTDTRTMVPGALFVALVGERFDAHDYLAAARDAGAAGAVVRRGTPPVAGPGALRGGRHAARARRAGARTA